MQVTLSSVPKSVVDTQPSTIGRAGQGRAGHVNDTVVWQSSHSSADVIDCTVGGGTDGKLAASSIYFIVSLKKYINSMPTSLP